MKLNYKRTFFVGLAFMSICAFWQVYDNVIPLILKDTFHVRDSYIGIVMAMDNVLALFMLPLFGKLSDKTRTKIGRRMPYILGGTILALLCLAIMPAAQKQNNALLFFIGLGLVLIAMATYRSPAVALMPDVTPKPLRSQGNAVINLMGAVGGMLMLLTMMIFPVTGDTPRYSAVFLVLGLVMAVCVAVLFWQIREPACVAEREAADRAAGSSDEDEGVTDAGGKMPRPMFRSLLFILASVFFWFFGYNAVTSAFSRYAEQELQGNFALVLMICTVAAIVSYMPVGMIAQRIGRKRTILIGIVMLGTAFFAGIFFHSVSPLLYIFFALAGMGWAFINVNSYPMVVELSKGSDVGKYTGYYYTVSMTAQIFTPILSNILMEHVGYRTLFPYAAFFVFATLSRCCCAARFGECGAKKGWNAGRGRLSVFFPCSNAKNGRRKAFGGVFCAFLKNTSSSEKKIAMREFGMRRRAAKRREDAARRAGNDHGSGQDRVLVGRIALPSMLAQFISVLYSIVDRIFIGQIPGEGALALAGAGVCGPVVTMVGSVAFLVGVGGAPLLSIKRGEGDDDAARAFWPTLFDAVSFLVALPAAIPALS
jgi:MFS family permease